MKNLIQLYAITKNNIQTLPVPETAKTIHDAFTDLSLGVYSALCTFDHYKFLHLDHHLDRMENSIGLLGWDYQLDRTALCYALDQVCRAYPLPNSRVRFDILAAPAKSLGTDSRLLIALAPLKKVPAFVYKYGVKVDIAPTLLRATPLVKEASFILERNPIKYGHTTAYEQLLLNKDGAISEGSSSNFYGIKNNALYTAHEGVLEGITRRIILNLAVELGIPINFTPIPLHETPTLAEAFITSSSRGLIPVVGIAENKIGDGKPGLLTKQLWDTYESYKSRTLCPAI